MLRIWIVAGTRPEVIKLAPLLYELKSEPHFEVRFVSTGQHREILEQALTSFNLRPDIEMRCMSSENLSESMSRILRRLGQEMALRRPDLVIVQGDTTSALAGALVAFYERIPIAHVESGLRSFHMDDPFPEEMHRRIIAMMASYHFAPTEQARAHLLMSGVAPANIAVTGNTVIDALLLTSRLLARGAVRPSLDWQDHAVTKILCTLHRRESLGTKQVHLLRDLRQIALEKHCEIILPVHPNPRVRQAAEEILGDTCVRMVTPTDYPTFVHLLTTCDLVITDSGGIQEEATTLNKFLIVTRRCTERPEALAAGALLVEPGPRSLYRAVIERWPLGFIVPTKAGFPFGDGRACRRIREHLADWLLDPVHKVQEPAHASP